MPRRRVVFVGVEGKSDRAFVRFLGLLCDQAGFHVHLDARPCSGGDSLEIVRETERGLRRHPDRREIIARLVLLDSDRMQADRAAGRDALTEAEKRGLEAVLIEPNLEGLLVRLQEGWGAHRVPAQDAEKQLRKFWSSYSKSSLTGDRLRAAILPRRPRARGATRRGAAQAADCLGALSAGLNTADEDRLKPILDANPQIDRDTPERARQVEEQLASVGIRVSMSGT